MRAPWGVCGNPPGTRLALDVDPDLLVALPCGHLGRAVPVGQLDRACRLDWELGILDDLCGRVALKGEQPPPLDPPSSCAFHGRCPFATERSAFERPVLSELRSRLVACPRFEPAANRPKLSAY